MKFLLNLFSFHWLRVFDFLAPLAIRLLLVPLFWIDGINRLGLFSADNFVWLDPFTWWNQTEFLVQAEKLNQGLLAGMGVENLNFLLGGLELVGAVLLALGLAVRWMVLGLLFVIVVLALNSIGGPQAVAASAQALWQQYGTRLLIQNPLEVYVMYFVLLLSLFFMGAGRWFSLDWFIYRNFARKAEDREALRQDPFEIDATDEPGIRKRL